MKRRGTGLARHLKEVKSKPPPPPLLGPDGIGSWFLPRPSGLVPANRSLALTVESASLGSGQTLEVASFLFDEVGVGTFD